MAWKPIVLALICFVFSTNSMAGEAHICYSPSVALMPATQDGDITDKTKIGCQGLAPMTIPQLAESGWKIVQVLPNSSMGKSGIELLSWLVVIQK